MWLDPFLKAGKDLVGRLNEHGMSSLRWLVNLEEEQWEGGWLMFEEISFNAGRNW